MRWIFLCLLLINLAIFVWSWMSRDLAAPPVSVPSSSFVYRGLPELEIIAAEQLLARDEVSDVAAGVAPYVAPEAPIDNASSGRNKVNAEGKALCEMVGAFESLARAKAFSDRLVAIDIAHTVNELDVSGGDRFWVYLVVGEGRAKVLERLAGLQAQGIDSYYIPRGELANTISLGVFSKQQLAQAQVKKMEAKGLSPKIKIKQQTYREIWVILSPGEHKKMSELTWSRLLDANKSIERRQNFCLDVAS